MEIKELKTFQYVADYLNYSKAAEALNFSQPAVSSHIQSLEKQIGQKLFIHVGKKTYLTTAGKELKVYADEVLNLMGKIERHFSDVDGRVKSITIAAYETYCAINLPPIIFEYLKVYKDTNIILRSRYTQEVLKGIRENKYDIGVISGEATMPGVINIPMSAEKMAIIVGKKIYDQYSVKEILELFPYIKYKADAVFYSNDIEKTLLLSKWSPRKYMEFGSLQAIKQAVIAGIGVGIMSKDIVDEELKDGTIINITPKTVNIMSQTSLITLEEKIKLPEVEGFIQMAQEMWKKASD